MKPSRLLIFLRGVFYFLEWATIAAAVVVLEQTWVGTSHAVHPPEVMHWGIPFYRFQFDFSPPLALAPIKYHGVPTESLWMANFHADLMAGQEGTPKGILAFMHWEAVSRSLLLLLTAAIFSLLRRLFDNVKKGAIFSMKSVRLIRLMGWCFVIYFALVSAIGNGLNHLISRNLSLELLDTDFSSASRGAVRLFLLPPHLDLDLTAIFFGLFAFALAEVFSQGLLLKEENDLTV
jgi:hypothetical protein